MPKLFVRLVPLVPVLLAATFFTPAGITQSTPLQPSPFEGDAFSMSATAMHNAAALIPADKISDGTVLYAETDYRISAAGTLNFVHRVIYRVETQDGVRQWAEASMYWDPWYQNPSQIHARVLSTNGSFTTLDQKTVTDAPINSDEVETYTSTRIRKAPLPDISIGSIVEEVVSVDEKKPFFANGSVYRYSFANYAATEREKVVVELPSSVPYHDSTSNLPQLTITRSDKGGIRRIVYERGHQSTLTRGDIALPSTSTPLPMLEFSTGTSWASVAGGYAALSDPSIRTDQVASLLPSKPGTSRMATIQLLVGQLHKQVRYTGVEFGQAQLVPEQPAQILARHYGDCKDKATLLVTLLRAANIPAHLALLSAGTDKDINPDLPGMDRFNHAIVYVPASGQDPALWIDATAEFTKAGTLPYEDSGRLALIITPETKGDPGTKTLVKTPDPVPEDSVLTETRTFTLAQLGPSHVVETSETQGSIDAFYRSMYGGPQTKSITDSLEGYGRKAYLAKSLVKVEHGDAADMTKPFNLTLTFADARRGLTLLDDAAVSISPAGALYELPSWIKTAPTPLPDNATEEQKQDLARQVAQRSPTYNVRPYMDEQRYRILAPAGFSLRGLPPDKTTSLGPATLTEHYAEESPGVVIAELHFTTGKSVITAQEALDFRQAVADLYNRPMITIDFEQTGAKLLAEGKIKDALTADRNTIAQAPGSALPHVRLAHALLSAGVGGMAREEAARAVALDPQSPAALTAQGWILQHDLLGNRFGPGFDRAGAIAAYRKALAVRTEDFDPRFNLAVLYEFDARGIRYSPDANLPDAISVYRSLMEDDRKKNSSQLESDRINLGYALLYNHSYKELETLLADFPPSMSHSGLTITSAVAQKDAAAGLAATDRLNLSADDRNKALLGSGDVLAQLGLYPQTADILSGIQGGSDAAVTARKIEMYRKTHRVAMDAPPVTSPESAVFAYYNLTLSGNTNRAKLEPLFSRHAYASDAAFQKNINKNIEDAGAFHASAAKGSMSEIVLRDIVLSTITLKSSGSDTTGYRVISQTLGGPAAQFFVTREDGTFRLVADSNDSREVGNYALYALDHHQPALAKSILDWKRDLLHKGGGDDPFSGPLLPLFWTVGSMRPDADSPESMRLAAISLLAGSMEIKPYLDTVVAARNKATGSHQTDLDLLLAVGYVGSEQPVPALRYIDNLLQQEPDSNTALNLAASAYSMSGNTASWKALLAPRIARRPTDPDLLRAQVRLQAAQHNYAAARASEQAIIDSGRATSNDYNNLAWLGLFDDHLGPEITAAAQQSNMLSHNGSFADLHTMACIYAAQDKVTEARQVLAQAMAAANLSRPESDVWYALGLLYEDYGLSDAALAAYRNVQAHEWDDHTFIDPESVYILAQKRIAALSAASLPHAARTEVERTAR